MVLLVGVIPLLFGLLLEMVVLMPVRVSLNQSPIFFLWQDWALGAMYTKITVSQIYINVTGFNSKTFRYNNENIRQI